MRFSFRAWCPFWWSSDYSSKGRTSYFSRGNVRSSRNSYKLAHFIQLITNEGETGPLYFFVDELDRCDPEYAIKLLESVKHFFDVDGIVFVLSVDRKKLGSMVRVRYGEGFDENGYLKRFVDVDYQIPAPKREDLIQHLCVNVLDITNRPVADTRSKLE